MNKTETKRMEAQMKRDRTESSQPGRAWCNVHNCKPGTCFPVHYPNAFQRGKKVRYEK